MLGNMLVSRFQKCKPSLDNEAAIALIPSMQTRSYGSHEQETIMNRSLILCFILLMTGMAQSAEPRKPAHIALVQLVSMSTQDGTKYLAQGLEAIDEAGKLQVEMIVLPEGVNYGPDMNATYAQAAIGLDSPELVEVSPKPKLYNCYIVFPFIQKERGKIYNSATVFGRKGELVGVYHKTHEPRAVIESQVCLFNIPSEAEYPMGGLIPSDI